MTARPWTCSCGARNLDSSRQCEACGDVRPRAALQAPEHRCAPDLDTGLCPCGRRFSTRAEGAAAHAVIRQVLAGSLSVQDGEREIARIFGETPSGGRAEARSDSSGETRAITRGAAARSVLA